MPHPGGTDTMGSEGAADLTVMAPVNLRRRLCQTESCSPLGPSKIGQGCHSRYVSKPVLSPTAITQGRRLASTTRPTIRSFGLQGDAQADRVEGAGKLVEQGCPSSWVVGDHHGQTKPGLRPQRVSSRRRTAVLRALPQCADVSDRFDCSGALICLNHPGMSGHSQL